MQSLGSEASFQEIRHGIAVTDLLTDLFLEGSLSLLNDAVCRWIGVQAVALVLGCVVEPGCFLLVHAGDCSFLLLDFKKTGS